MSKKSPTRKQFWHFSISKKAQLPAIRIPVTEQPMLLTKGKINRPGYKLKYFRLKQAVKSRTRSRSRPRTRI